MVGIGQDANDKNQDDHPTTSGASVTSNKSSTDKDEYERIRKTMLETSLVTLEMSLRTKNLYRFKLHSLVTKKAEGLDPAVRAKVINMWRFGHFRIQFFKNLKPESAEETIKNFEYEQDDRVQAVERLKTQLTDKADKEICLNVIGFLKQHKANAKDYLENLKGMENNKGKAADDGTFTGVVSDEASSH